MEVAFEALDPHDYEAPVVVFVAGADACAGAGATGAEFALDAVLPDELCDHVLPAAPLSAALVELATAAAWLFKVSTCARNSLRRVSS